MIRTFHVDFEFFLVDLSISNNRRSRVIWRKLRWSPPCEEASESNDMAPEIFARLLLPAMAPRTGLVGRRDNSTPTWSSGRGSEHDGDDEEAERKRETGREIAASDCGKGGSNAEEESFWVLEEVVGRHRPRKLPDYPAAAWGTGK
jgi:hypothetical protein